jgi:REP element-mobilizing transposase RayT
MSAKKKSKQLAFVLRTHGGRRRGAGRKPKGAKARVSHQARPKFVRATPVHVTLRVRDELPNLRGSRRFRVVTECFDVVRGRASFRLVEFSVLSNHLHLVVEAEDSQKLSRGVQGLCVRLARALNRSIARSGRVFADHFHSRLLRSPTEVLNAIRYVLGNAARHYAEAGPDDFSSSATAVRAVLAVPTTWLVRDAQRRLRPG